MAEYQPATTIQREGWWCVDRLHLHETQSMADLCLIRRQEKQPPHIPGPGFGPADTYRRDGGHN